MLTIGDGSIQVKRRDSPAVILTECYSLNPAWVEQAADATRHAVECR